MKKKKLYLLLLSFILLMGSILNGCKNKEDPKKEEAAALGRYIETEHTLPEKIQYICGIHQNKKGELELLATTKDYKIVNYISKDNGITWVQKDFSKAEKFIMDKEYALSGTAWDKNDRLYLCMSVYEDKDGNYAFKEDKIGFVDETGEVEILDYSLTWDELGGVGVNDMKITDNGDFIIRRTFSLTHVNGKTGKILNDYKSPDNEYGEIDDYSIFEDTLTFSVLNTIYSYDLASKEKLGNFSPETYKAPKESNVSYSNEYRDTLLVTYDTEGTLYYMNQSGLYRCMNNNTMFEKVIDGDLTSFGIPSIKQQQFFIDGDKFIFLNSNNETAGLMYFEFDATVPTLPSTELSIYSLYENQTLRQSIGMFARSHPDVHITLEIGVSEGVRTEEDERKRLTTSLIAGEGPDIILMDSLPLTSFEQKALLLDLSETLDSQIKEDLLLSNIALAYQKEDKSTYTVPARFQVPMILGSVNAVDSIHSLSDLRQWLTDNKDSYESPLNSNSYGTEALLRQFYTVCASSLISEDGSFSKEALSSFLEDIKLIDSLDKSKEEKSYGEPSFDFGALPWMQKTIAFDIGNVNFFEATYAPYTALLERKDGKVSSLFGQNIFIPSTLLSVNAQTDQKELALSFIEFTLSEQVLTQNFYNGMPVSKQAFLNWEEKTKEKEYYSFYGTGEINLQIQYPTEEFCNDISDQLQALSVRSQADNTILSILLEETKSYFNDKTTLEHAVQIIVDKINTYLSEQN